MEAFASNPAEIRPEFVRLLRREMSVIVVTTVFLLIVFLPLGMYVWKWLWLGLVLIPLAMILFVIGSRRLLWHGDVRPAQVISLDPPQLAIYADLTMRPDAAHPAIVIKETSFKCIDERLRVGDHLAVAAFYAEGDDELSDERWKGLSVIEPIRGFTGDQHEIQRTFDSIENDEWQMLATGMDRVQVPCEEHVIYLEEGRKPGGAGVAEGRVLLTPSDDPDMKKAQAYGRKTLRFFLRELSWENRRIIPGLELAAVKVAFSDPPELRSSNPADLEVEYMWISEVEFDGRTVKGVLLNQPDSLQSVSEGDRVSVHPKEVVDWLYSVMGETCGGFTVQRFRSRMSKRERKQHDEAWGLDFGAPGVVRLVPDDYLPEETASKRTAIPEIEGMFIQGSYKTIDQLEHPMSINMRESLEETLGNDPEMLSATDAAGLPLLHSLTVAGSLDGVDVCLRHGADPNEKAANGVTPARLAKGLGWKKVLQRLVEAGART